MSIDLTSVEIVFAQRLASGEPVTRRKALESLQEWIQEQSRIKPFQDDDMIRLCTGLHYVLWMQDKMILQEELADKISNLLEIFKTNEEKSKYIKAMFLCLAKEWCNVDRWRMDKFLMLMRRVVRVLFQYLKKCGWKKESRDPFWKVFRETTISLNSSIPDGLKSHFAAIFLDELDNSGGLTKKQMTNCLKAFADILSEKKLGDYLFDSILDEIFMTILHQKSVEIDAEMDTDEDASEVKANITFDYKAIGKMLFDIGKDPQVNSKRRRKLYNVVKKYEDAAKNMDPLFVEKPKAKDTLKDRDLAEAEEALENFQERIKNENAKHKEELKALRQKTHEERYGSNRKEPKEVKERPKKKILKVKKGIKKTRKVAQKGLKLKSGKSKKVR